MLGAGVAAGVSAMFCTFCVGAAFSLVAQTGAGFGGGMGGFEQDEPDGQDKGAMVGVAAAISARICTFCVGVVFSLATTNDGDSDEKVQGIWKDEDAQEPKEDRGAKAQLASVPVVG